MSEKTLSEIRAECDDAVQGPGKFEGEPPYVPYYFNMDWGNPVESNAFPNGGGWIGAWHVTIDDRALFPGMLDKKLTVYLYESETGFVQEISEQMYEELDGQMYGSHGREGGND